MFEDLYKETFQQIAASPDTVQEVLNLKNKQTKRVRLSTLAAAVLLICVLATTAFAYTGFVVYENPGQMLDALFGAGREQNHAGQIYLDSYGQTLVDPAFQREELDKNAADMYVAPHILEVGQSLSAGGNTLTVDAVSYDPHTQCGVLYMHLENPDGLPDYYLQANGEVTWNGPELIRAKDGLGISCFLDEDQSSNTKLTLAGYFYKGDWMKQDVVTLYLGNNSATDLEIPLDGFTGMEHITLGSGGIQLSPIGIVIHGDKLGLLRDGGWETNTEYVCIRYTDGSEYLIKDDTGTVPVVNHARGYIEPGDGYETDRNCATYLLNRIVPVGEVSEVIVDGVSYPVD